MDGKEVRASTANRSYQDTVFRMLFSDRKKIIELYNALEGTDFGPDTPVEITTLEDVLYIDRKNDLSFKIAEHYVVLTEHQSTINNCQPIRQLGYVGRIFDRLTEGLNLYGKKKQMIPTPEFYVIYTGEEPWESELLRLSDSFLASPPENSMELVVKVIDLRYTEDNEILKRSETLEGYSRLLYYIKQRKKEGTSLEEAIRYAVGRCIEEDCLADFLRTRGREVQHMLLQEITWEEFAELRAKEAADDSFKEGFQTGRKEGHASGIRQGIFAFVLDNREEGVSEDRIREKLMKRFNLSEDEAEDYLREVVR